MVRLIHHDQVVGNAGQSGAVFGAARGGERSDQHWETLPRLRARRAKVRVGRCDESRQPKFDRQFLAPLLHQRRGRHHHQALHDVARQILLDHQSRLDCFAQPHLVAKHPASAKTPQHDLRGARLIIERLKLQQVEADQLIEPAHQLRVFRLQPQAIQLAAGKLPRADSLEQGRVHRRQLNIGFGNGG